MSKLVNPFIKYPPAGGPPGDSTLNNGINGHWTLDEAPGQSKLDSVGSHDWTDQNTVDQITGKVGFGAADITGIGRRLSYGVGSDALFDFSGDLTIAVWHWRPAGTVQNQYFFQLSNFQQTLIWDTALANPAKATIRNNAGSTIAVTHLLADATNEVWNHLILTFNRTTDFVQLWTNGVKDESITYDMKFPLNNDASYVGPRTGGMQWGADELAVWQRVLTDAECLELYNQGVAGNSYPWPSLP